MSAPAVPRVPLSVLDLVPITGTDRPEQALQQSLDLVRATEAAGYRRYWFAEHHLNPGVLGSSPAVLIALAASVSSRIRLGSGAVQLGHRTALSVAEEFALLALAHPGRIDLGLGRSGGRPALPPPPSDPTERITPEGLLIPAPFTGWGALLAAPRFAGIRRLLEFPGADPADFEIQVDTILAVLAGKYTDAEGVTFDVPGPVPATGPEVWLLGSSAGTSANLAGRHGLPFAANYHVAPAGVLDSIAAYRAAFRPSADLAQPYVVVSADVVVGETDAAARELAAGYGHWVHSIRSGAGAIVFPTPEQASAAPLDEAALALVDDRVRTQLVGAPDSVVTQLQALQVATGADELLITTITAGHADRVRSYQLLAQAWRA
ncbi:LLM class flavin-dependent oxidoreductase [Nakamurella leprariae]|uniref:LLM class flavin-dependent oxidoreductase n=1 Tax=Nakamurella leprariae TaxID=2803911 RepID=A0A939BUS9_9ACTN|nr:LLM class flavin-dependent oxidoreductase [Nakamurella leprariae]MBM9465833.1 LLM class flavin-dependent oxidoreductase [Nakamurella leprariae]